MRKRRHSKRLGYRCGVCNRRFGVVCAIGHKYSFKASDRRRLLGARIDRES